MATIHKLTKDGSTIFPATITDAIVHPNTGKTLTSMIKDYNVSELFPSEGLDGGNKYNLALAIQVLGTHLTAAEKTGGIKITFISSVSPYPEEEYYLNKNVWSTTLSDWGQRFEVGDVIANPSGSWTPSTAEQYIDQKVGVLNAGLTQEVIARQTGDSNLQTQLNSEAALRSALSAEVDTLEENVAYIGENDGSSLVADFDPQTDTVWKKPQVLSSAEKTQVQTNINVYGKDQTYTKQEVNGLVDTPHQNYVTVATYASLPASGSTDTIYRVSNYNGSTSQVDASVYSEYAWNGSAYIFLCVKSQIGEVFDISVYNNNSTYADLAAALGNGGENVPESLRKGGMSVKYVQTSDNNYVQYRYMGTDVTTAATFTNVSNWQGVDDEPTAESKNLVKSRYVYFFSKGFSNIHRGWMGTSANVNFIKQGLHSVFQVTPGDKVIISTPYNWPNYCIAFLASYTPPTENEQTYDLIGTRILGYDDLTEYVVPSGANYIWIGLFSNSPNPESSPRFLKINDKVIVGSFEDTVILNDLNSNLDDLNLEVNGGTVIPVFERGSLGAGGVKTDDTTPNRIRTKNRIPVFGNFKIHLDNSDTFQYFTYLYPDDTTGFEGSTYNFAYRSDDLKYNWHGYIAFVVKRTDGTAISITDITECSVKVSSVLEDVNYEREYVGEKIVIKKNTFDLVNYGSFPNGVNTTQGFAIHNKYCIQGSNVESNGKTMAALIDLDTRTKIADILLAHDNYSAIHCNMMSFGNETIEGGVIPLLYASQWDGEKCCFVYDVQLDGTSVLKQVISPANLTKDGVKFGIGYVDWVVDPEHSWLFAISYKNAAYSTGGQIITKFKLPKSSDGAIVELNDSDIIDFNNFGDYILRQDGCYNNGKIYIIYGSTGSSYSPYLALHVIDVFSLNEVSTVNLQYLNKEPEGLDIYNEDLVLHTLNNTVLQKFFF